MYCNLEGKRQRAKETTGLQKIIIFAASPGWRQKGEIKLAFPPNDNKQQYLLPHQEDPGEYDHEAADVLGRRRLPLLPPAPGHPVGGAEVLEGGGRGVGAAAARRGASSTPPEEVGGGDQEGPHAGQERRQTEVQRALLHSGECIFFCIFL